MLASCLRKQQVLSRHNYVLSPAKSFSEIIYQRGGILEELCPSPRELSPTPQMGHRRRWKWARLRMPKIMSPRERERNNSRVGVLSDNLSRGSCQSFFKKNSPDFSFSLSVVGLSPFYFPQLVSGNLSISLLSPGSTQNYESQWSLSVLGVQFSSRTLIAQWLSLQVCFPRLRSSCMTLFVWSQASLWIRGPER